MKNYLKLILATALLTFFVKQQAHAGRGDKTRSIHTPQGGSAVVVGTATAKDSISLDPLAGNQRDYNVKNRISFGVDIHYPEFVAGPQIVEVSMHVKQYDVSNNPLPDLKFKLNIEYYHSDTLHSRIMSNYEFSNAYRMIFRVDTIRVDGTVTTTLPKNLFVQGDIFVERYTELGSAPFSVNAVQFLDVDCDNLHDGIHFSWPAYAGAEEYQLEFMHISNYGSNNTIKAASSLAYNFRKNSTRVTTSDLSYDIALLFDRGWIAWRVRPVGVDIDDPDHLIFGNWNITQTSGTISALPANSKKEITNAEVHEGSLNWQYSATYAEQGKRKEVITYYDGTLRNRQAVTKINTDQNVVVGETIYDHQGRPAVTVLPTPVENPTCDPDAEPTIRFYSDFNKNMQGTAYSKTNFDVGDSNQCAVSADMMSTSDGASRYYSPSNPDQNLHQAYVPDAKGYPFQQVEYTPDNTGRISKQGGVGPEFQIGTGKETRYLYGNPNQLELNKLFGSEVGYSDHYQKNAVIDANGQVSVSYVDMTGKVIATALAGDAPQNVEALDSIPTQFLEVNHILPDGSNQVIDHLTNSVTFASSFIVTSPTEALIDYQMLTIPMTDSCLNGICVDCVYELELSLRDDCGVNMLPDSLEHKTVGNFQLDSIGNYVFHSHCTDSTNFSSQIEVNLNMGKYTIAKKLTIKEEAIYSYLNLIDSSDCILSYQDFLDAEMQNIDSATCMITCDNCLDQLGTLQDFISNGLGSSNDYYTRVQECQELCEDRMSDCQMYLTMMQIDMSPGGQYAEYLNPSSGVVDLNIPLSVFNGSNQLPNPSAGWRNPVLITPYGTQNIYADASGERSKIFLSPDAYDPNIYTPAPQSTGMVQYDAATDQYFIYPEQLQSVEDFIDYFEQSWAASLVKYHPEYCFYESCIMYEDKHAETDAFSSSSFDALLYNTKTFAEAQALGFITPSGVPSHWFIPNGGNPMDSLKPWDPFVYYDNDFETGICTGYGNKLVNKFNNYEYQFGDWYTMAEIAAYTVRCGSNFPSVPPVNCYSFGQPYNGVMDTVILNKEWALLKAMYMSAKQGFQQDLAKCKAIAYCDAYNTCIGKSDYTPFPIFGWIQLSPSVKYYPFLDHGQPCSVFSSQLYRYKTKRFSDHEDAMKEDANSTAYELYLQTGQCPNAFALQNLLNELAHEEELSATAFNLNTTSYLSALFQGDNSFYNPGAIPSLEYSAVTTTNTITANWNDVATSSLFATMTLNKTAPQSWSQVTGIVNLFATGAHTFSAEATYLDIVNSTIKVFPITGSLSYFELQGCTFEQECKSNQLALDLTTVFNVLAMDNNLFSATPINLASYSSTSIGSTVGLTSLYIENAAGMGSNLSWRFLGSGKVRIYDPTVPGNNGLYLEMDPTYFQPSLTATGYNPMTTTGNYSFEMVFHAAPTYPLTVTGVMYQIHNGDTIGISAGNCDLPTPNKCEGQAYEVFDDLQPLLEDVLVNYNGSSTINLYTSIYTTPSIVSVFPYGETQTTSVDTGDSLIISAGACDIVLTINPSIYVQFDNLVALSDFELTGEINAQSGYNHFVAVATFSTPSGNIQDTIYGSTCFTLKDCHPCSDSSTVGGSALRQLAISEEGIRQFAIHELTTARMELMGENALPTVSLLAAEANCDGASAVFNNCVDWFNAQGYPVTMIHLSPVDLRNLGWCGCVDSLCAALHRIIDSNIVLNDVNAIYTYLSTESGCVNCATKYLGYVQCLSDFINTYSGPLTYVINSWNIMFVDYETFAGKYCDCADSYCELLNTIIVDNIQFSSLDEFSSFVNFSRNCGGCSEAYTNYVNAITAYNTATHTYTITPISESSFVANNYCNCVGAYKLHLEGIIDSVMQFSNESEFLRYISLNRVCKDDQINEPENPCKQIYSDYLHCTRNFLSNTSHSYTLPYLSNTVFDSLGLCSCVDAYCSALDAVMAGIKIFSSQSEFEDYVFGALDCNRRPPCTPAPSSGVLPEMPVVELENDCIAAQITLAIANAENAYNIYKDSVHTVYRQRYVDYCMSTQEKLYTNYNDRQHHYTLYYYDVAGNLIKTIPPGGVDLLPINSTNDAVNIQINNDRNNGTKTVFTSHRLQTRYEYNSLNQLVAQYTPDTDPMDVFEQTLPNGLHNKLVTRKIQMINSSLGYLAGNVGQRGYLYKTTDGGKTWSRLTNLVAADLKKIVMLDASVGIAIGEAGTVLKTVDGGYTWDMIITWNTPGMIKSLNDVAIINPTSSPEIMLVGDDALAARCTNFTSASPTFTVTNTGLVGNVMSIEVLSGQFYCTAHNPMEGISRFYRYASSVWTELPNVKTSTFSDVHIYDTDKAYAVDYDGRIYGNSTFSGVGSKWIHRSSNLKNSIYNIRFFTEQQGVAIVEENGDKKLFRTINAAAEWTPLSDNTYTALAIAKDHSVIVAGGENRRLAIIFPYVSGVDQLINVNMPYTVTDITAVWAEKDGSGNLHVIASDNQKIWYTKNALTVNPVWTQYDYSAAGSTITEMDASIVSGNIYGVAVTASGQAWRLKKDGTPSVEMSAAAFSGSNYGKVAKGASYFYLSSVSGTTLQRAAMDATLTLTSTGTLPFVAHYLNAKTDKLAVANETTGSIAYIPLNSGGTSLGTANNQTLRVYPDKINVLKRDTVNNKLFAFGNDGLAYHWDAGTSSFIRINNQVNEHIYNAFVYDVQLCIVGQKGLARGGVNNSNITLSTNDLITTSGQTVAEATGYSDLYGVDVTSGLRLYITGANGTLLYSPVIAGVTTVNPSLISQGTVTLRGVAQKPGSNNVLIAGSNGRIQEQFGAMSVINQNLFIPPVTDIHFKDASSATVIASNFVARTTGNGGGSWKIVKPQGIQNPVVAYKNVWTLAGGKSLLFGNGTTLLHNSNSGTTATAPFVTSNVKAVAKGTNDQNIFIVDGNDVKKIQLASLATTTLHTMTGTNPVNAMHVFSNGDHILVGDGGLFRHFNPAGMQFMASVLPTVDFNAIAFKDNLNGIIVGDGGTYYYTVNHTVSTSGYLTATQWQSRNLSTTDPLGVTNADIYAVAAASSVDILIGGVNPGAYANAQTPYVRKIYDAGGRYSNKFYYDRLGRLVVSRNARQQQENKYSYTLYDALGRVVEAGEKTENTGGGEPRFNSIFGTYVSGYYNPVTMDDTRLNQWIIAGGARKEVTRSYYDEVSITGLPSVITTDLHTQRLRIVHTAYEGEYDGNDQTFDHATHYQYDIHGNVKTLLQDNKKMETEFPSLAAQRFKQMDYSYDLLSGNVHRMSVQNGEADQWHHAYVYDADNRTRKVYTNTQAPLTEINRLTQNKENELSANANWQNDAQYYYYDHGPLARVELGQNNLQGVDYYHNLQGWLKGVNSSVLDGQHDPGQDSDASSVNATFAKDVIGFGLSYFQNDYAAIGGATPLAVINNGSHAAANSSDLYNGNISYMQTSLTNPTTRAAMPMLNAYNYDQLNRLRESRSYETGLASNEWNPITYNNAYFNAFKYDAMGNILTQERHKQDGTQIEELSYRYQLNTNGKLVRNRLYHVNDAIAANVDSTDIDDMGHFYADADSINLYNNYMYDAEGRLVKDLQEEIDTIIWRVDGKVKSILRTLNSEKKNLTFDYNSNGKRIAKHVYNNQTLMLEKSTYYILDAQGNQLAMYDYKVNDNATVYYLAERNIYGSSRLGTTRDTINMYIPDLLPSYGVVGNRNYEMNNHLGNVLAVVNDIVYPLSSDNTTVDSYEVGITQVGDYSPFGVQLDGRTIDNYLKDAVVPDTTSGSSTPPSVTEVYRNEFDTPAATTNPYTGTPTTLDANLSMTQWSTSTGSFTNFTGVSSTKSIAISTATPDTAYLTLSMNVASGYELDIASYSFYHRSSGTGYTNYKLVINGVVAGSGAIWVSSGSTLQSTGIISVSNPITGITTTANVVLKLYGGTHGAAGTFRMDNFSLNGYTQQENNSGGSSGGYVVSNGYRYGFNSMEKDDEVKGRANSYDFGARMYDSRLGRWLTIDPLVEKYPSLSPYNFVANMPTIAVDPDGKDIIIKTTTSSYDGKRPTKIGEIAVTKGSYSFSFNTVTNEWDLIVNNHIQYSSAFKKAGANGKTLEQENPGLLQSSQIHEGVHVDRNIKAANSSISYTTHLLDGGAKTFTGTADKVMTDIFNAYILQRGTERADLVKTQVSALEAKYNPLIAATNGDAAKIADLNKQAQAEYDTWANTTLNDFDQKTNDNIKLLATKILDKVNAKSASLNVHEGDGGVNADASKKMPADSNAQKYQDGQLPIKSQGKTLSN